MKNSVSVVDLIKIVDLIDKQNDEVRKTLGEFRGILKLLDPKTEMIIPTNQHPRVANACLYIGIEVPTEQKKSK